MTSKGKQMRRERIKSIILALMLTALVLTLASCGQAEQAKQAIDTRSIHSIPESYGEKSLSQGTLKTLTYSSRTYDSNNTVATKKATVYLHHGYSADKKYNILYLMHGYGGDENTFLGSETSPRYLKRMLDHMISAGDIDPLIVVTPTLTWGSGDYYSTMDNFQKELTRDLMPAAEGRYSTYAAGTSSGAFVKSRDHRAMAGFSMGGCITWQTLRDNTRYFKYYLPMSCPLYFYSDTESDQTGYMTREIRQGLRSSGYSRDEYFVFAATGSRDYVRKEITYQIGHLKKYTDLFKYTTTDFSSGNLMFYTAKGHHHSFNQSYVYIYNGLIRFFR